MSFAASSGCLDWAAARPQQRGGDRHAGPLALGLAGEAHERELAVHGGWKSGKTLDGITWDAMKSLPSGDSAVELP